MKIKLNSGTELNVIQVNGSQRYFQGQNRDSLEIVFEKDAYTFDNIATLFADKTKTCGITTFFTESKMNESGETVQVESQRQYDDYILRASMELRPVVITPATSSSPEVSEERVFVVMAQLTFIEKKLSELGLL